MEKEFNATATTDSAPQSGGGENNLLKEEKKFNFGDSLSLIRILFIIFLLIIITVSLLIIYQPQRGRKKLIFKERDFPQLLTPRQGGGTKENVSPSAPAPTKEESRSNSAINPQGIDELDEFYQQPTVEASGGESLLQGLETAIDEVSKNELEESPDLDLQL